MGTIRVKGTLDPSKTWEFNDKLLAQGGMKDVYMSPDRSYVVGFFRSSIDPAGKDRLNSIVGKYFKGIYESSGSDFWKSRFCWPVDLVVHEGRTGVVAPAYPNNFFFKFGSIKNDALEIKNKDKEGKWFASTKVRRMLAAEERGEWKDYLRICLNISRAVRRMHAAGLAHSDLSYKNVLVDPTSGEACIIDIDGLVVPGKFPPDVVGTPDFIAPEVLSTLNLPLTDPKRKLPNQQTDLHALAVLTYMYLLFRHPLKGGKIWDSDPGRDVELSMGSKALFIEHPQDNSNRVKTSELADYEKIWGDPSRMPMSVCGPYLKELFTRAFVDGLHDPMKRPIANDWEVALVKTMDLLQKCSNKSCEMKWYIFDNTSAPRCPYCQTPYSGLLPVMNFYSKRTGDSFKPDNQRLMVWDNQSLFPYHVNRKIFPNENLKAEDKKRVGYFQFNGGKWWLFNESLTSLQDVTDNGNKINVAIGGKVELREGALLLLSSEEGGKLAQIQLVGK